MGHSICALVVAEPVDEERAKGVDLLPVLVHEHVTVLPIDHYYSEYWAIRRGATARLGLPPGLPAVFPAEAVLLDLVREVTGSAEPLFAVVQTDYFGGVGEQWAVPFRGATRLADEVVSINAALRTLGVRAAPPDDEFDTIGLGRFRANPEHLDRYQDLG